MFSSRGIIFVLLLVIAGAVVPSGQASEYASILILTDRTDGLYECGDSAAFFITVVDGVGMVSEGEISVELTLDGGRLINKKTLSLGESPAVVRGALHEPGFLLCRVTYKGRGKEVVEHASVGFSPERIRPTASLPGDFDSFWQEGRDMLKDVPLDLELIPEEKHDTYTHSNFRFSMANINGTRVYGFLSIPNREPPYPAYVTVEGAGHGPTAPNGAVWASKGALGMVVSVHDYDCGRSTSEIRRDFRELNGHGAYQRQGAPDREAYYFRRAILGIDRAIDYLVSRDDFDGQHLVFAGASQGGAMALILAGMNPHVTAVAATIPAMCEHSALLAGREAGWPKLLKDVGDKERHDYLEMGYYYDVVNFARSVTCPVIVIAGLKDRTCPPSGIIAAYNTINAPKRLFTDPRAGHQSRFVNFEIFRDHWIEGQLGLREPMAPTKGVARAGE